MSVSEIPKIWGPHDSVIDYFPLLATESQIPISDPSSTDEFSKEIKKREKAPIFQELLSLIENATDGVILKISLAKLIIHAISGKPLKEITPGSSEYAMILQWIKNSIDTVFNDPYRSFLEIILNAIDSGVPANQAVGQFCLGFKSIFAFLFLKDTNGCKIVVNTQASYHKGLRIDIELERESQEIWLEFKPIDVGYIFDGGTSVKIIPTEPFPKHSLKKILEYSFFASHTTKAKLKINHVGHVTTLGSNAASQIVEVNLSPYELVVRDYGCGVSPLESIAHLFNFCQSSKKGAKSSSHKQAECLFSVPINFTDDYKPRIKILINSIVVFEQEYPFVFDSGNFYDFLIYLPYCPQVTSRNKFSIDQNIIFNLIDRSLINSFNHPKLINALYIALQTWEKATGNDSISGVYTSYLKTKLDEWLLNNPTVLVINIEHAKFFYSILPVDVKRIFLLPSLANYNFRSLEKYLQYRSAHDCEHEIEHKAAIGRLIPGRNIAFADDVYLAEPSHFNFWNLTFIPKSWLTNKTTEQLVEEITFTLPHLNKIEDKELAFLSKKIDLLRESSFQIPTNFEEEIIHFTELLASNDLYTALQKPSLQRKIEQFRQSYISILSHSLNFDLSKESTSYITQSRKLSSLYQGASWNYHSPIISKTLIILSMHPLLFNKILDWSLSHWAHITGLQDDPAQIKPRLVGNFLVIPGPTYTSPLGMVALLINNRISLEFIFFIISETKNVYEFLTLGKLIYEAKKASTHIVFQYENVPIQSQKSLICLKHYITHILHGEISSEELRNWYSSTVWIYGDYTKVDPYLENFKSILINVYHSLKRNPHNNYGYFLTSDVTECLALAQFSFSQKQLLQSYILNPHLEEILDKGDLRKALSYICVQDCVQTDRLRQVVEQTNAHPYYFACVQALLRNSVEAIRTQFYSSKDIYFKVCKLSNGRIYFCAEDYVGFHSLSTLLKFLNNDHTRKDDHLGIDIFILYKQARQVVVTTKVQLQNQIYIISITPIRDETKQVVDLQIRITEASNEFLANHPNFKGTRIEVCSLQIEEENFHSEYLKAYSYFKSTLESCTLSSEGISLWIEDNDNLIKIKSPPTVTLFEDPRTSVSISGMINAHDRSCVTIGGVFFQSLYVFNEKHKILPLNFLIKIQTGIALNLPFGFGKVLQNRCDLTLSAENIHTLRMALANAFFHKELESSNGKCFIYSFEKGHIGIIEQFAILPFTKQLEEYLYDCEYRNNSQSIENFMTHFCPQILEGTPFKNFRDFLDYYAKKYIYLKNRFLNSIHAEYEQRKTELLQNVKGKKLSPDSVKIIIDSFKAMIERWKNDLDKLKNKKMILVPNITPLQSDFLNKLYSLGVEPWISSKFNPGNFPVTDEDSIRKSLKFLLKDIPEELPSFSLDIDHKKINYDQLVIHCRKGVKVLNECLTAYAKLYIDKIDSSIQAPSISGTYNPSSSSAGTYYSRANSILLNYYHLKIEYYFLLLGAIAEKNKNEIIHLLYKLFVPTLTAGCVINHELEHRIQDIACSSSMHGYVKDLQGRWVSFESSTIFTANRVIYLRILLDFKNEAEKIIAKYYGPNNEEAFYKLADILKNEKIANYVMRRCCKW